MGSSTDASIDPQSLYNRLLNEALTTFIEKRLYLHLSFYSEFASCKEVKAFII